MPTQPRNTRATAAKAAATKAAGRAPARGGNSRVGQAPRATTQTTRPARAARADQGSAVADMTLPTEKTPPSLTVETANVFCYGPKKIGKSTLVHDLDPDVLFLSTEPGLSALNPYKVDIRSWEEFRGTVAALQAQKRAGTLKYKVLSVDTVDELLKFCQDKVMRDLNVKHPSDLEFGKGWEAVTTEFRLRVGALTSLGVGVWFISHAKDKEVKKRIDSITVTSPAIGGGSGEWLQGFCDFILLVRSELGEDGEERVIRTLATENYVAGGRVVLADPIPLDAAALREEMEIAIREQLGDTHQPQEAPPAGAEQPGPTPEPSAGPDSEPSPVDPPPAEAPGEPEPEEATRAARPPRPEPTK